jgi:hypothetical protein
LPPDELDDQWWWVAGFLEADGAFYVTRSRGVLRGRIQCRSADREVLARLRRVVGGGRINGPYDSAEGSRGKKLTWLFQVNRQSDVLRIACRLKPHMSKRRQNQIGVMLDAMRASGFHGKRLIPEPSQVPIPTEYGGS